jgi:hypothetical protein
MDIPQILDKAADVIETRGWHQGGYVPENSDPFTAPCCVAGAIYVAAGLLPNGYPPSGSRHADPVGDTVWARRAFSRFLGNDAIGWNDDVAETPEQVITALRECAAELSKETTR